MSNNHADAVTSEVLDRTDAIIANALGETREVAVIQPAQTVLSDSADSLMQKADILIRSGMLPGHLRKPEQVVAIMLRGKELGIGYMEALTSLNFIKGKVSSSTQLMLALIYRSGKLENIEMVEGDPARVMMKRRGMTAHRVEYGTKEATRMGLMGQDNYRKQPTTMFMWRAIAICARRVFPDVVGAVYTPDELGIEIQSDTMREIDDALPIGLEIEQEPDELTLKARSMRDSGASLGEIASALGESIPSVARRLR